VYEYVADSVERARINCWGDELPPFIICEARATRGVLERTVAAEYLCPITATGGQSAGHIVNEIVPLLQGNERKVLYIGDCEESGPGDQIEANTRRYSEKHTKRTFTPETWIKVALTPEQVARTPRLRRLTIDKVDNRCRPPRPYKAVECEAVGQAVLERMLRKVLDDLLPEPLADVHKQPAGHGPCRARQDGPKTGASAMMDVLANILRAAIEERVDQRACSTACCVRSDASAAS
jgi:hypothetical protein